MHKMAWQVPYEPGTLKAIGMNGDQAVCSFELKTTGQPTAIKLIPNRQTITADGRSFSFFEAQVVDADGHPVFAANNQLAFEIIGPGRIFGHSSGDLSSHESFRGNTRKVYQGRCLVVIQSTLEPGTIKLKATAPDLTEAENTIHSSK
jgi:beta-galactosidase